MVNGRFVCAGRNVCRNAQVMKTVRMGVFDMDRKRGIFPNGMRIAEASLDRSYQVSVQT